MYSNRWNADGSDVYQEAGAVYRPIVTSAIPTVFCYSVIGILSLVVTDIIIFHAFFKFATTIFSSQYSHYELSTTSLLATAIALTVIAFHFFSFVMRIDNSPDSCYKILQHYQYCYYRCNFSWNDYDHNLIISLQ